MATVGDWLTGNFDLFGTAIQNWMVAVPAIIALSISVACWNR
jgi:hypothetical protein